MAQAIRCIDYRDLVQSCDADSRVVIRSTHKLGIFTRHNEFSRSRKNPYAKQLRCQVTIRLEVAAVDYFKQLAAELGMPYQNLINLFLRDCDTQKASSGESVGGLAHV